MGSLALTALIFCYVVFRIGNRAYSAYSNGYSTWPILTALAVIYTIVAVVRYFFIGTLTGTAYIIFVVISLGCIFASQAIYRSSANSNY